MIFLREPRVNAIILSAACDVQIKSMSALLTQRSTEITATFQHIQSTERNTTAVVTGGFTRLVNSPFTQSSGQQSTLEYHRWATMCVAIISQEWMSKDQQIKGNVHCLAGTSDLSGKPLAWTLHTCQLAGSLCCPQPSAQRSAPHPLPVARPANTLMSFRNDISCRLLQVTDLHISAPDCQNVTGWLSRILARVAALRLL